MPQKYAVGLVVALGVIVSLGLAFSLGPALLRQRIGEVRPAFGPAAPSQQLAGQPADPRLQVPAGFRLTVFAQDLPSARDLQFSPGGTLLLSQRTQGKVVALPDQNQDGQADRVVELLTGIQNPHGLAFRDGKLFVASERAVNRYRWDEQNLTATWEKQLLDLPAGGGGHFTRSLVFDRQGNLLISVGSTCNVCLERDERHGSVLITNAEGDNPRIYARGLRNAVFMHLHEPSGQVLATENGRDLLGDDLPPDELNILQAGANYGWPYCYGDRVRDLTFGSQPASICDNTQGPTYQMQAHSAALGLTTIASNQFPSDWQGDLFVAYRGSWNRSVPTGYKVVRLALDELKVVGEEDFLTGFLQGEQSIGRPVDVTFDPAGRLYVSDDKGGVVFLITAVNQP